MRKTLLPLTFFNSYWTFLEPKSRCEHSEAVDGVFQQWWQQQSISHQCRFLWGQHAGSCSLLVKMNNWQCWLCWKPMLCSWEFALSHSVIVLFIVVAVSMEINRRNHFQSGLYNYDAYFFTVRALPCSGVCGVVGIFFSLFFFFSFFLKLWHQATSGHAHWAVWQNLCILSLCFSVWNNASVWSDIFWFSSGYFIKQYTHWEPHDKARHVGFFFSQHLRCATDYAKILVELLPSPSLVWDVALFNWLQFQWLCPPRTSPVFHTTSPKQSERTTQYCTVLLAGSLVIKGPFGKFTHTVV